jgi:hypothetical protein
MAGGEVPVAAEHSVRDRIDQIAEAAKSTFSIEETPCGSLASVYFFRLDRMVIGERHQQKRDLGANRIGMWSKKAIRSWKTLSSDMICSLS